MKAFTLSMCLLSSLVAVLFLDVQHPAAASLAVKPDAALRLAFPDLKPDSIRETDVTGLYEVVAGTNIYYYYPAKDYLFVGEIFTKDRQSLTAGRRKELSAKLVKTIPLEKGVKIGTGKHTVIEFTDPDCPYCRKASELLRKRKDITRYVFFTPLAHPQAINKIHYILNAKDKATAYEEMMRGDNPPKNATYGEEVKSLAQEHINLAKKVGVQGTPTFFINGKEVVGADEKKIDELLR